MTEINVKEALNNICKKIADACEKRKPELQGIQPKHAGQRHFGKNYIQDLEDKANKAIINLYLYYFESASINERKSLNILY